MAEAAPESLERCLSLLDFAISSDVVEEKTKVYTTYDPLKGLADRLEAKLEKEGFNVVTSVSTASTSSSSNTHGEDSRIRYSALITELLNKACLNFKLCDEIEVRRISGRDTQITFTAKQLSVITSAVQFFVPTSISPYLDKGVGNEVESRSKLVKHWKLFEGDEMFKRVKLHSAMQILFRMARSSLQLNSVIIPRFLGDIISANEQLIYLGDFMLKEDYEKFIHNEISRPVLMFELFSILNRSPNTRKDLITPVWFKLLIGRRLSELIIESNGLYYLTTALTEDGGKLFENFTFVQQLAKVLSIRPQFLQNDEKRRPLYYANILKQFLHIIQFHPMSARIATWFAATLNAINDVVPRAVDICIFDTLLHPWELLSKSMLPSISKGCSWDQRLDSSLKTLSLYIKGLPPGIGLLAFERFLKLFPLWLQIYGNVSTALDIEDEKGSKTSSFAADLGAVLAQVLEDPAMPNNTKRADFILGQINTEWFHIYGEIQVVLDEKPKVVEVPMQHDGDSDHYVMKYENVRLYRNLEKNNEMVWLDCVISGIVQLFKRLEKSRAQPLLLCLLSQCVQKWKENGGDSRLEDEDNRFVTSINRVNKFTESDFKFRVQYLIGHFGELVANLNMESEEVLLSIIDVAKVLINSAIVKVKELIRKGSFDVVTRKNSFATEDEAEIEKKSIEMAVALLSGTLLNVSKSDEISCALSSAASDLEVLCGLILKLCEPFKNDYKSVESSGKQLLEVLKALGVKISEPSGVGLPSPPDLTAKRRSRDLLDEIYNDLEESAEPMKGHALILLARMVRKRDERVVARISNDPELMKKVVKQIVHSDSYVYLAAINAMAELAYWKKHYFDMMVDFFLNPDCLDVNIASVLDLNISEVEKKDFLVIQRVKIGEALAKVCRALGDMAAWHFERLINPLIFMVRTTRDSHLKASSLSALADLILACRGRGFHSVLNEILLLIEQFLIGGREAILRRSSLTLLRAIIVSFNTSILTELSSQLRDIHRHLRRLLLADQDDGVRLLAELCLIDIKEQLNQSVADLQDKSFRKIRIS